MEGGSMASSFDSRDENTVPCDSLDDESFDDNDELEPDDLLELDDDGYDEPQYLEKEEKMPITPRAVPKLVKLSEQIAAKLGPPKKFVVFPMAGTAPVYGKKNALYYRVNKVSSNVVRNAFQRAGFKRRDGVAGWNGVWGNHLKTESYKKLTKYQKVNHFPRSFELGRKDSLCRNMMRMRRYFPTQYDFYPKSFILPRDYKEFVKEVDEYAGPWISKPCASCRGIGIKLITDLSEVSKKKACIISRYISSPFLINELKFDLRIYVLVTSFDPLRIYIYDEGLVRFSTHKYKKGTKHVANRFMHLTNYSVNHKSKKFVEPSGKDDENSHKWSMAIFRKWFRDHGIDDTKMWAQISDLIIKTMISVESAVVSAIKMNVPNRGNCYELFGFDVLLDESLKPWLLEVNVSPSLSSSSPMDKKIKSELLTDVFNLVGFEQYDRKKFKEEQEAYKMGRLTMKPKVKKWEDKQKRRNVVVGGADSLDALSEEDIILIKELHEEYARKGHFERIFPTVHTESYLSLFEFPRYNNMLMHEWLQCCNEGLFPLLPPAPIPITFDGPGPAIFDVIGKIVAPVPVRYPEGDSAVLLRAGSELYRGALASGSEDSDISEPSSSVKPLVTMPSKVIPSPSISVTRPRSAIPLAPITQQKMRALPMGPEKPSSRIASSPLPVRAARSTSPHLRASTSSLIPPPLSLRPFIPSQSSQLSTTSVVASALVSSSTSYRQSPSPVQRVPLPMTLVPQTSFVKSWESVKPSLRRASLTLALPPPVPLGRRSSLAR